MSTYTFPGRVPDLVQDVSLKRARTEVEIDGEKKDVIRVLSAGAPNLDAQGVADAMATAPDATIDVSSVLGRLTQLNSNLSTVNSHLGDISEAVYDPEESGTLLDNVQNNTAYTYDTSLHTGEINNTVTAINTVIGSKSDAQWVSGDGSLIALGKKTAASTTALMTYTSNLNDTVGTTNDAEVNTVTNNGSIMGRLRYLTHETENIWDCCNETRLNVGLYQESPWTGSGSGSLVAIEKRTSNDTHAAANVLGTTSDTSVSSSNDGTINARVRYISSDVHSGKLQLDALASGVGNQALTPWSGSGSGSLVAIAKRTSNDTNAAATATGTQSDTAWDGQTTNATIIALLKGIYNKL